MGRDPGRIGTRLGKRLHGVKSSGEANPKGGDGLARVLEESAMVTTSACTCACRVPVRAQVRGCVASVCGKRSTSIV